MSSLLSGLDLSNLDKLVEQATDLHDNEPASLTPSSPWMPSTHAIANDNKPMVTAKAPRKRARDSTNPRTKVACTCCYLSKACCDQARPCGRCVRLGRPEECRDRVHKKRTVHHGPRAASSSASTASSSQAVRHQGLLHGIGVAPDDISVELLAERFSKTLADMWLAQCQASLEAATALTEAEFHDECRRITHVTETMLGGLLDVRMYADVKTRLRVLGIHVSTPSAPIFRPPFQLISADEAGESTREFATELNVAIIKSVQLPGLLNDPVSPRRGLYINDEAQRLFGYDAQDLCDLFNRLPSSNAFTPFWSWVIGESDWVKVIQHNALFFLSSGNAAADATRPDIIVTCYGKSGKPFRCLASTRSSSDAPRSYRFCFVRLLHD
ncbi:unnamed protein product (mitochondrion) [Plasmodiophora brassicae]|uniref:Zn(2)-C6 fungal-type domain-containing protein n=1 Tax=Plasmodiophora brassicae TaxID=37360 RepID=A0A0G4J7M3_PLABS|nr:hypothetical protein PBRA_009412 [Plasmodiophora brassicae]SPR00931.1 unnamed protein product [Plasmodiophora brassicae]